MRLPLICDGRLTMDRTYLQSPYLFMCCDLMVNGKPPGESGHKRTAALAGTVVSSLHRLKDINNQGTRRPTAVCCKLHTEFRL
jgi:hypothetical protein